jgi:putative NADPH-quinone reductase
MKKILIINGHPDSLSFCEALSSSYENGAKDSGFDVKRVNLRDLKFDPILHNGYRVIQQLEPDLISTQESIKWADHVVWVYPVWWLGTPALLKGFIDRAFIPGFGFKYKKDSIFWNKLLKGKSSSLIITMDAPYIFNLFRYGGDGQSSFRKGVLWFCGFSPIRTKVFDRLRFSSEERKNKMLDLVKNLGKKGF